MVDFNGSLVFVSTTFSYLDNADWVVFFSQTVSIVIIFFFWYGMISAGVVSKNEFHL